MIQVIQYSSRQAIAYALKHFDGANDFVVIGSKDFAVPYVLLRMLIPQLRKRLGDQLVEDQLVKHKIALSPLFATIETMLTAEEKAQQDSLCCKLESNITHSRVAKATFSETFSQLLIELMGKNKFRIVIPDMTHIDTGSLDLLKFMYQVHPEACPDLVIGYDPDWEEMTFEPELGLAWYYGLDSVTTLQSFVYAFEAIAEEVTSIALNPAEYAVPAMGPSGFDLWDDRLEMKVYDLIQVMPEPLDASTARLIFQGIRKCFRLYDFTNTLLIGLRAHKAISPFLSREEKALLYHSIGLSAHNRHFFSQGNMRLAQFLTETFLQALVHEQNPSVRIALNYRLAVTYSRRMDEQTLAKQQVVQAYLDLEESDLPGKDKETLTAWIKNIDSFILMKVKDLSGAIRKHKEAFYLLDDIQQTDSRVQRDELDYSMAVLAENLATLHSITGNLEQMEFWNNLEQRNTAKWPNLSAIPPSEWQSYYFQNLELQRALDNSFEGIQKSKESFNYILEYFFTLSASDIYFRLGQLEIAQKYLRKSKVFQQRLGYEYITQLALEIQLIKTTLLQGHFSAAIDQISSLQEKHPEINPLEQVELFTLLATANGNLQLASQAETYINSAIDLALDSGEGHALFLVCVAAGNVSLLLNRKEDAAQAYHQALGLSDSEVEGKPFRPDPGKLGEVYLRIFECDPQQIQLLEKAIQYLAGSLVKSPDSWWQLRPVLKSIANLTPANRTPFLQQHQTILERIFKAAAQRLDCQETLSILNKITVSH